MSRITIFGGRGKVARLLIPILVARGDEVTAVIRNDAHADELRALGADPIVFDVERETRGGVARMLEGQDAVVWSAGAGGGDAERTMAVDRDGAIRSMDAAGDAGALRYVMVSYFGSSPTHGVDPANGFFSYAEAKAAADAHLRRSSLDWTVLGPSSLTMDEPSGLIDTEAEESGHVSRGNVAAVVAQTLVEPATIGRTIRFNDGSTPIADALRG